MQDTLGRWYSFSLNMNSLVCLEKGGVPDHLKQLPSLDTPVPFKHLLAELEDSGEAGASILLFCLQDSSLKYHPSS